MPKREDEIEGLFKAPLSEFIAARKTLAARLKKNGQTSEAEEIKSLAKPSISAWTVNQLYWRHRDEFNELIATGQRFHKAQQSGKIVNMREALDARREALSQLSDLAAEILRGAGNNASLETLRRIATTLEALSAYTSLADRPTPGRLTHDIDPPGFDSFGAFSPAPAATKPAAKPERITATKERVTAGSTKQPKARAAEVSSAQWQARVADAKASLQHARKSLTAARAALKSLETAEKKAEGAAREAVNQKREAEDRFKKAVTAAAEATLRAQNIKLEITKATKTLTEAESAVAAATRELEASFRKSPVSA